MKAIIRFILTVVTLPLIILFGIFIFAYRKAYEIISDINFDWFY
jgi:uncharacterized membrane protein YvlD (DUF360 family)